MLETVPQGHIKLLSRSHRLESWITHLPPENWKSPSNYCDLFSLLKILLLLEVDNTPLISARATSKWPWGAIGGPHFWIERCSRLRRQMHARSLSKLALKLLQVLRKNGRGGRGLIDEASPDSSSNLSPFTSLFVNGGPQMLTVEAQN